jgi:hypothetical protein
MGEPVLSLPKGQGGCDKSEGKKGEDLVANKRDAFVKSPVHPSIPQGERIIKTVSL